MATLEPVSNENEAAFQVFYDRMRATRRVFIIESVQKGGQQEYVTPNFFENDHDAVVARESELVSGNAAKDLDATRLAIERSNADQRDRWTKCCRMEFGLRNRQFHTRFPSMQAFYVRFTIPIVIVLVLLATAWPVWNVLVDIEAEDHFRILGVEPGESPAAIKKAYRAQAKQWHPDHNPNCGQVCRDRMMRLQKAHDVLLARGDMSQELANKYKDALTQIRSFLVFRLYQMSFYAAEFTNTLMLSCLPLLKPFKGAVRLSTRIGFIIMFVALEIAFITGVNVIVLLQVVYFCSTMLRESAALTEFQKISKWSYMDIRRDAVIFVVPSLILHGAATLWGGETSVSEYGWHAFVGLTYLCAHLMRFSPNLWDNFALKKCSVSVQYLTKPDFRMTTMQFLLTELGVLVDDVFAFSSHAPSVFRVAVLVVHGVYLTQFWLLPHDLPIKNKLRRSKKGQEKLNADSSSERVATTNTDRKKVPLTEKEMQYFSGLDGEPVLWMDLVHGKYAGVVHRAAERERQGQPAFIYAPPGRLDIVWTHNNVVKPLMQVEDRAAAMLLAREAGPVLLAPTKGATAEMRVTMYQSMVPRPAWLTSALFRHRPDRYLSSGSGWMMPIVAIASMLLIACAVVVPAVPQEDADALYDPLSAPSANGKHRHALPESHLLNHGAGTLRFPSGPLAVITPDMIDALRQLSLYKTDEEETTAYHVVAPKQPRQKPKPGHNAKKTKRDKQQP